MEIVWELVRFKQGKGFTEGPLISDLNGYLLPTREMDDCLQEVLEELYHEKRVLFPPTLESDADIRVKYQVYRSLRKTSDTQAINRNVDRVDIDVVNKWQRVGDPTGKKPAGPMRDYYASYELLEGPFERYTWAM